MNRTIYRVMLCVFCMLALSTIVYSEEELNYWKEYVEKQQSLKNQISFLGTLSVEQMIILGNQMGEEYEQKAKYLSEDQRRSLAFDYGMAFAWVYQFYISTKGEISEEFGDSELYQLRIEPIADPETHLLLQTILVHMFPANEPILRYSNYKALSLIMILIASPDEDAGLRAEAFLNVCDSLYWEHTRPSTPLSDDEKEILLKRTVEFVNLCRQIIADADSLASLRKAAGNSLQRLEKAGIIDKIGSAEATDTMDK